MRGIAERRKQKHSRLRAKEQWKIRGPHRQSKKIRLTRHARLALIGGCCHGVE